MPNVIITIMLAIVINTTYFTHNKENMHYKVSFFTALLDIKKKGLFAFT